MYLHYKTDSFLQRIQMTKLTNCVSEKHSNYTFGNKKQKQKHLWLIWNGTLTK